MKLKVLKPHAVSKKIRELCESGDMPAYMAKIMIASGLAQRFRAERKPRDDQSDSGQDDQVVEAPMKRAYKRRDMVAEQ